ncbi:MAG: helix-turn-helix domain-containing protein [Planctomycetaceae bacterium]|nr:helix-turn-helix domain-containing protein [Planctomycetaceae bacterium]
MSKKTKKTKSAIEIIHHRYIKGDKGLLEAIADEKEKLNIAAQIHEMRTKEGLSQNDLAERMGTTQSVISRLESTDYRCENLSTLQKIASVLHCRLEVKFVPDTDPMLY